MFAFIWSYFDFFTHLLVEWNKKKIIIYCHLSFIREKNSCLAPIPSLNVDTGMGFERLTAVLQGTMSNYDTDIFMPLFKAIERVSFVLIFFFYNYVCILRTYFSKH